MLDPSKNQEIKQLVLNTDVITMQCNVDENFEIFAYMDFNRKKFLTYTNNEVPFKLNVEKLAKKRLNIKDFWKEVQDVRFKVNFEKNEFILDYYLN